MTRNDPPLLYLSQADIRGALPMTEAIEAVQQAYVGLSEGRVTMPAR
jgi:ornithine cyclodeaminase/alanine dehydrogenase-like protein (mu-crystallin family)